MLQNLSAIEDVTVIGYAAGIYGEGSMAPIARRGITATPVWSNFQNKPAFLIDAGVFPGASGSPVFLHNQGSYATPSGLTVGSRVFFIGVLSAGITSTVDPENRAWPEFGHVIKSDHVWAYLTGIVSRLLYAPVGTPPTSA